MRKPKEAPAQAIILARAPNGRLSVYGPCDMVPGPFGVEATAAGMASYAPELAIVPLEEAFASFRR